MAIPSWVLVPRPSSSRMTNERSVAREMISEASLSSSMNVLRLWKMLSEAPILKEQIFTRVSLRVEVNAQPFIITAPGENNCVGTPKTLDTADSLMIMSLIV